MKKLITILILIISFDSIGQQFADTTALKTYINDSIPQNFFTHDRTRQLKNALFSVINFTGGGGGGGGTVTSVAAGFGTSFTTITGTGSVIVDTTSGGVLSWRRGAKLMDSLNTVNLTGNGTATYVPYYSTARVLTSNVRFSYSSGTGTLVLRGVASTDNALLINTFNDVANAHIFKTSGIASLALPAGTDVGIGVSASGTSGAKLIVKGDATNTAGAFFRGNADANVAFGINTANDASNRHLFYSNGNARLSMGAGTISIRTSANGTAYLHIGAGTASANTAPLKFTSGTNLTTAEAGAMEYDGTNLFFTRSGTTRETFTFNDGTQTLTNKRITKRVGTTASSSSLTIAGDDVDMYTVTALAADITINAPSGTPTQGQTLLIRLKDNGTGRLITWNAIFRAIGVTLPTTTTANKTMYVGCVYNTTDSKWDIVSVNEEA